MKNLLRLYLVMGILVFSFAFNSYASSDPASPSDAAKQYLEIYEVAVKEISLDGKTIRTKEDAIAYIEASTPKPTIDTISYSYSVIRFRQPTDGYRDYPEGRPGYIHFRITVENDNILSSYISQRFELQITPTPYEYNSDDFLAKEYSKEYKTILDNIKKNGVKMSDANTPEAMKQYITLLAPAIKSENVSFEIKVFTRANDDPGPGEFEPAKAGTSKRKKGINGFFSLEVSIENKLCKEDKEELMYVFIKIIATPYTSSSSGGGSSGGSSSSGGGNQRANSGTVPTTGMTVIRPSVFEGIWQQENGKWKLILADGTWANVQWACIKEKWYLFGTDGYMVTGWAMVNNKWYYLDNSGIMLQDTTTPDGYQVGTDGAWITE